jgi:hypothetical protein
MDEGLVRPQVVIDRFGRLRGEHIPDTSARTSEATRDHFLRQKKRICWGFMSSNVPWCPTVPCLALMKEIVGKHLGI